MKLEGDLRRSQRACQQLDTQKVILLPAFRLVKYFGPQYDLPCMFFWPHHTACVTRGQTCALCIGSVPSALEVLSLNHWTTRNVPYIYF